MKKGRSRRNGPSKLSENRIPPAVLSPIEDLKANYDQIILGFFSFSYAYLQILFSPVNVRTRSKGVLSSQPLERGRKKGGTGHSNTTICADVRSIFHNHGTCSNDRRRHLKRAAEQNVNRGSLRWWKLGSGLYPQEDGILTLRLSQMIPKYGGALALSLPVAESVGCLRLAGGMWSRFPGYHAVGI